MQQHELRQPKGATHKRKRVGRGNASGHGTYATKGMKGQKARSGGGVRPGFEGGQLPLVRRMAYKRGFRNPFRVDYEEVNVGSLAQFAAGTQVNAEALQAARLVRTGKPVKVLGTGEVKSALKVEASSFSKSAIVKIEAAGGSVYWLQGEPATAEEIAVAHAAKPKQVRAAKVAARAAASAKQPAAPVAPAAKEEASDGAGS
jgi:large subunit ribosomal protein L15